MAHDYHMTYHISNHMVNIRQAKAYKPPAITKNGLCRSSIDIWLVKNIRFHLCPKKVTAKILCTVLNICCPTTSIIIYIFYPTTFGVALNP